VRGRILSGWGEKNPCIDGVNTLGLGFLVGLGGGGVWLLVWVWFWGDCQGWERGGLPSKKKEKIKLLKGGI